MKIDYIFPTSVASMIKSTLSFLWKKQCKSKDISKEPTSTGLRTWYLEPEISNIHTSVTSKTDMNIDEFLTYYFMEEVIGIEALSFPDPNEISKEITIQVPEIPKDLHYKVSEERYYYPFGRISGYLTADENTSPNSTKEWIRDEDLERRITSLFMMSGDEEFESGMISDFSQELFLTIVNHGKSAVEIISYLLLYKDKEISLEVICEALRWLGRIDQVDSHSYRLWLLEKNLESPSRMVRDSAILGIASMDDPSSIPAILKAIEKETCHELCEDMKSVLEQLEESSKLG